MVLDKKKFSVYSRTFLGVYRQVVGVSNVHY